MFDFDRWCSWAEAEVARDNSGVALEFRRGGATPKPGASIAFKGAKQLLSLDFWVTGEADFHGIDLQTGAGRIIFWGRMLDDASFQQTFEECLAVAD